MAVHILHCDTAVRYWPTSILFALLRPKINVEHKQRHLLAYYFNSVLQMRSSNAIVWWRRLRSKMLKNYFHPSIQCVRKKKRPKCFFFIISPIKFGRLWWNLVCRFLN